MYLTYTLSFILSVSLSVGIKSMVMIEPTIFAPLGINGGSAGYLHNKLSE